jgi:uncharacterized protein YoxC
MDIIILLRIASTLTFFIVVLSAPYALIKLNRFIRQYYKAHKELEGEVAHLKTEQAQLMEQVAHLVSRIGTLEARHDTD